MSAIRAALEGSILASPRLPRTTVIGVRVLRRTQRAADPPYGEPVAKADDGERAKASQNPMGPDLARPRHDPTSTRQARDRRSDLARQCPAAVGEAD